MNLEERINFVWHNGVKLEVNMLIALAKGAGDYTLAQPFLVSLLAHGLIYGYTDYIDLVNEVRAHFQLEKIPVPKQEDTRANPVQLKRKFFDDLRKKYQKMNEDERACVLKEAISSLIECYPDLFKFKNQWQGIYLVVRDRLDLGLNTKEFLALASKAMPMSLPLKLQIHESVFKNMSRDLANVDIDYAYYEMEGNPHQALCDIFWDLLVEILGNLMKEKSTKMKE